MNIVGISFAIIAILSLSTALLASVAGFLASADRLASHSRALDAAHDSALAAPVPFLCPALSLPAEALGRLMLAAGAASMASERKPSIRARQIGYRARSLASLAPAWLCDAEALQNGEIGDRDVRIGGKAVMLFPAFRKAATLGSKRASLRLAA